MTMTITRMSRAEVEAALQHEIAVSREYGFVIVDLRAEIERLKTQFQRYRDSEARKYEAEVERLTTELRLVRQYARDTLAAIDANPSRTLLEAAIFE